MVMTHTQSNGVIVPSHKVYFNFQNSGTFLFKGWHISSTKDFIWALMFICVMAITYEVVHGALTLRQITKGKKRSRTFKIFLHLVPWSVLHILRVGLGYTLMMTVMTYNSWMMLTISLAAGLGFFISRPIQGYLYSKLSAKEPSQPHQTASHCSAPQQSTEDYRDSIRPPDNGLYDNRKEMSISEKEIHAIEPLLKPSCTNSLHSLRETVL